MGVFASGVIKAINTRDGQNGKKFHKAILATGDGRLSVDMQHAEEYVEGENVVLEGNVTAPRFEGGDFGFTVDKKHTAETLARALGLKTAPATPVNAPAQSSNGNGNRQAVPA